MTDVLQATLLYETDRKVFFLDTEIGFCVSHLEVKTLRKKIQTDGEQRLDSAIECVCRACRKLFSSQCCCAFSFSSPQRHDPKEALAGSELLT